MTHPLEDTNLVVTFLQSVGRPQDAFFYLKLFTELPKESFAVVVPEPRVLKHIALTVAEPLAFLAKLGLHVTLATGFWDEPESSVDTPRAIQQGLAPLGLRAAVVDLMHDDAASQCTRCVRAGMTAVVDLRHSRSQQPAAALAELTQQLGTRKVVVLRSRGGLGPHRSQLLRLTSHHQLNATASGISVVSLATDYAALRLHPALTEGETQLLDRLRVLHRDQPKLLTSVTSPLNLFQELFTIKGAGTLVKTGSDILTLSSYQEVDRPRLQALLESTFDRALRPAFLATPPLSLHVERDYRGAAIVHEGLGASYLTKFAVTRAARGEGMGRDLWEALHPAHPALYWRARADNPISAWYRTLCDGMQHTEKWIVFWRGIPTERLATIIDDACAREEDFETATASS